MILAQAQNIVDVEQEQTAGPTSPISPTSRNDVIMDDATENAPLMSSVASNNGEEEAAEISPPISPVVSNNAQGEEAVNSAELENSTASIDLEEQHDFLKSIIDGSSIIDLPTDAWKLTINQKEVAAAFTQTELVPTPRQKVAWTATNTKTVSLNVFLACVLRKTFLIY